jgi:3',5'-cyclic AMP phosphodiesterase CpdA
VGNAITFVHLSDVHLGEIEGEVFGGIDPLAQARRVLARIRQLDTPPAFFVISGDLSNDGSAASYDALQALLRDEVDSSIPLLLALGNHDDRASFRRVFANNPDPTPDSRFGVPSGSPDSPYNHSSLVAGLRVIVLDSTVPGEDHGYLEPEQLAWLDEQLAQPGPRGSLIVLHHCCRLASSSFDVTAFGLRNAADFEAVVARHPVLGVLAGHSHQANTAPFAGTLHITAPSTLCQLDFFAGPEFQPLPGAGFNLCQVEDGQLIVSPVLLP